MLRILLFAAPIFFGLIPPSALAQVRDFAPVTREMPLNPSPDDWLMFSRTYDKQRFNPLDQITRRNVGQLRMAWVRGMAPGVQKIYLLSTGASCAQPTPERSSRLWMTPTAI